MSESANVTPAVLINDNGQQPRFEGVLIEKVGGKNFFRISLDIPLTTSERYIQYFCDLGPVLSATQKWHRFPLPGSHTALIRFGIRGRASGVALVIHALRRQSAGPAQWHHKCAAVV